MATQLPHGYVYYVFVFDRHGSLKDVIGCIDKAARRKAARECRGRYEKEAKIVLAERDML